MHQDYRRQQAQTQRDTVTILTHSRLRLAKLWKSDGSISPYEDAKNYSVEVVPVADIHELHALLTRLEGDQYSAIVRGTPNGAPDPEAAPGCVRRIKASFDDEPHHWVLIEVDNFQPRNFDPVTQPVDAIGEFLDTMPAPFRCAAFHWQLSNSAGSEKNRNNLKVHLWFWMTEKRDSATLKEWAKSLGSIDPSVMNAVQLHYTAAPLFDEGVENPVPLRSGFEPGMIDDAVEIDIAAVAARGGPLAVYAGDDENARALFDLVKPKKGWTIEQAREILMVCDANAGREEWVSALAAVHYEFDGSDEALDLVDEWSSRSTKYQGRDDVEGRWDSFGNYRGNPLTGAWLLRWRDECLKHADPLASFFARYAVARWGSTAVIVDFQTRSGGRSTFGVIDPPALRTLTKHLHVEYPGPNGTMRRTAAADAWLADPRTMRYEGVEFAPPPARQPDSSVLNLWRGFGFEPRAGDISLWSKAMESLVPDERIRHFAIRWLAWKVQNPGGVPGTILVVRGKKGTGKNSVFEAVARLFGSHGSVFTHSEEIAGRFSEHLMNLAFGVIDEAVFIGDPRQANAIKSRVTATEMTYEGKGLKPVQGVNRAAYVICTNHEHVWEATSDERRAVIIEAGDSLRGQREFWTSFHAKFGGDNRTDDSGLQALLYYLQNFDIADFEVRDIPKGDALNRQIEHTAMRDPLMAWWAECLYSGCIGAYALNVAEPSTIPRQQIKLAYEEGSTRGTRTPAFQVAAAKLRHWTNLEDIRGRDGDSRPRCYVFPPLPQLREQFAVATGVRVDC